jgi:hypothetical protein
VCACDAILTALREPKNAFIVRFELHQLSIRVRDETAIIPKSSGEKKAEDDPKARLNLWLLRLTFIGLLMVSCLF